MSVNEKHASYQIVITRHIPRICWETTDCFFYLSFRNSHFKVIRKEHIVKFRHVVDVIFSEKQ